MDSTMFSCKTKYSLVLSILLALVMQTDSQANIFEDFGSKKKSSLPKFTLTLCAENSDDTYAQKLCCFSSTLCDKLKLKHPPVNIFKTKDPKSEYNAFAGYVDHKEPIVAFGNLFVERWREGWISDQEIEAIMAHELSHLKLNHSIKTALLDLALNGPSLVRLISVPSTSPKDLAFNAYSRKNEKEADTKAIKIIDDPMALFTGLIKLQCLSTAHPKTKEDFDLAYASTIGALVNERKSFISPLVELLSTHPLTSTRMAYIKKYAKSKAKN